MVAPVVYLVAAALLVGLIFFLTRSRGRAAAASQESQRNEGEPVVTGREAQRGHLEPEEQRAEGRPRRRRDLGSRLLVQRRAQRVAQAEVDEYEEEAVIPAQEEEGIEKPVETHVSGKIGAKKLRKLEEKQARKAQREAEEAEREERKRLESQREAEWRKEEERLRLEEEQKVRSHSFLTEFVNYIKQSKVVLLETWLPKTPPREQHRVLLGHGCEERRRSAVDTINRIQDLLAEGTLTGVIDDRGKFIYITPEELAAVANFIRQRGRVSITELAQASNSLIAWGRETPTQAPA
nr:DDRGK domain-containing protein 1 [Loxodonta africana]